jgi:hypothetical protein
VSDLEFLEAERTRLRAEYKRVVTPLLDQIMEVDTQIMNLKREAGQLFYVEYMSYHTPYTEECETLSDAKGFALALVDNGNGFVTSIHGPGVDLDESNWED